MMEGKKWDQHWPLPGWFQYRYSAHCTGGDPGGEYREMRHLLQGLPRSALPAGFLVPRPSLVPRCRCKQRCNASACSSFLAVSGRALGHQPVADASPRQGGRPVDKPRECAFLFYPQKLLDRDQAGGRWGSTGRPTASGRIRGISPATACEQSHFQLASALRERPMQAHDGALTLTRLLRHEQGARGSKEPLSSPHGVSTSSSCAGAGAQMMHRCCGTAQV